MKNKSLPVIISILLILSLLALVDPFMYLMPPMVLTAALVLAVVLMATWTGLVMYEKTEDERDVIHRMKAGRAAYLSGMITLTIALLVQGIGSYTVDPWLAITLIVMILAKMFTRVHSEHNN